MNGKVNILARVLLSGISLSAVSILAIAQTSPSPFTYGERFDVAGRVVGTIAPDPDASGVLKYAAVRKTYDSTGRITAVEMGELSSWQPSDVLPANWGSAFSIFMRIEAEYDNNGNKTREIVRDGTASIYSVSQFSFDARGRILCATQRMNPAQFLSLPADACEGGQSGISGPDRIQKNVYDAAGQLLQVRKAVGTTIETADATYTYTPNGKRRYVIDANGNRAEFRYDGFDRQIRWVFPSPTKPVSYNFSTPATALSTSGLPNESDYESYSYDANGNRTSLRKRDGSTLSYNYDALDRLTRKTVPERAGLAITHTRDVYYGYNVRGLQTYARFDSGGATSEGVTTTYDGFGHIASSAVKMDGVIRTLSYAWDKNGNRTELTWPDAFKNSYVYDGLDRMKTLFQGGIGSTTNMVGYNYNNRGLRATQSGRYGPVTTFGYDPIARLNALSHDITGTAQDVAFTFSHNPVSQMAQQTRNNDTYAWNGHYNVDRAYAVNGLNQYTSAGGAAFNYDANGNLTSDGSTTYVYDIENRLVSASGGKSATLRYDPLGRLYETVGGGTITRLLYDGDELVAEYNTSGTLLRRYAHGKNFDDPVVMYEGAGATAAIRWLHADHQGSIIAITGGTGAIVATNSYDEYGIPAATNSGRFQYTGQAWIPELGMYYYKARIYSPTLGRFLQADPIGYEDQVNLYAYVGSDPVNNVDLSGNRAIWVQDKLGNVTIQYILAFSGPDAGNLKVQKQIVDSLSNLETPRGENIEVIVVPETAVGKKGVNQVNLSATGYLESCKVDSSCGLRNGNKSWVDTSKPDAGAVGAHEISHNGNADDGYTEGPRVDGQRTFGPDKKPANDIMTRRTGTAYTQQTVDEIREGAIKVNEPANKYVCAADPEYTGC